MFGMILSGQKACLESIIVSIITYPKLISMNTALQAVPAKTASTGKAARCKLSASAKVILSNVGMTR